MRYTLITGASAGVGRELAINLSKDHNLILNGRSTERLLETQQQCANHSLIWAYDLCNYHDVEAELASWIKTNEVQITSFVHCAGVMRMVPIRAVKSDLLNSTFAVNVFAPALITKTLAAKKNNGRELESVVYISSNLSNRGAAAFSVYGASKASLDGMMRNLAVELAPSVRINSVLPGGMVTEMTKDIFQDEAIRNEFMENYPLGIGTPSDIAPVVRFLLSEESKWMTGQQITVDGGRTIDITERRR